jgi:hypothetical protein
MRILFLDVLPLDRGPGWECECFHAVRVGREDEESRGNTPF